MHLSVGPFASKTILDDYVSGFRFSAKRRGRSPEYASFRGVLTMRSRDPRLVRLSVERWPGCHCQGGSAGPPLPHQSKRASHQGTIPIPSLKTAFEVGERASPQGTRTKTPAVDQGCRRASHRALLSGETAAVFPIRPLSARRSGPQKAGLAALPSCAEVVMVNRYGDAAVL